MSTIRELRSKDWDDWHPLWTGYLGFYRAELKEEVGRATFERMCEGRDSMFGLIALDEEGRGIGMADCMIHATTWSRRPTCYLEDLFVEPATRGQDLGRALLEAVKEPAPAQGAGRVYWHPAVQRPRRSLYDQVGRPTSFVVYEM